MLYNVAFIGGIHGVGKSTICKKICDKLEFNHLSASEVLKWQEISKGKQNKNVKDISVTQDRLINGLISIIEPSKQYLLDGHYCLLDSNNNIIKVPLATFKLINPTSLNIVIGDIKEIKERLENRDNKLYDYNLLREMQACELNYANELSKDLGTSLNIGTQNDFSKILTSLNKLLINP